MTAAQRWATAWLYQGGQTREAWLERLAPLTTDEYLGQLTETGDDDAAATEITGTPRGIDAADGSATVEVPTDLQTLRLELIDNGRIGWQVAAAYTVGDTAPSTDDGTALSQPPSSPPRLGTDR